MYPVSSWPFLHNSWRMQRCNPLSKQKLNVLSAAFYLSPSTAVQVEKHRQRESNTSTVAIEETWLLKMQFANSFFQPCFILSAHAPVLLSFFKNISNWLAVATISSVHSSKLPASFHLISTWSDFNSIVDCHWINRNCLYWLIDYEFEFDFVKFQLLLSV